MAAWPRLRCWCAFSCPVLTRRPRLAPTKNNRRQRHGPAERQRRGSAADANPAAAVMGCVEHPTARSKPLKEPIAKLKFPFAFKKPFALRWPVTPLYESQKANAHTQTLYPFCSPIYELRAPLEAGSRGGSRFQGAGAAPERGHAGAAL